MGVSSSCRGLASLCLSRGELYTILINKEKTGRSGSIIAIVKGTDVRSVTSVLLRLSRRRRFQVREITMDMAPNMEQIARVCFPAARRVTDRFHVQKLAFEALQEMRVKARWEALDKESIQIAYAKACGKIYHAPTFENGDSRKQLLALILETYNFIRAENPNAYVPVSSSGNIPT